MIAALIAIGVFGIIGHLMFWVGVFNRVHATGLPYKLIKLFEKMAYLIIAAVPLSWTWIVANTDFSTQTLESFFTRHLSATIYLALCLGTLVVGAPVWLRQRLAGSPHNLLSEKTTVFRVRDEQGKRPIGNRVGRMFSFIPWNESFDLHVSEKTIQLPRLPPALEGLTIVHLSDLHFTGQIARSFFDFAVDRANEMQPDLAVVTGDLVDVPACIEWIRPVLGRLQAKYGVYCILGNHDKRLADVRKLREEITTAGMIDLGGKAITVQIQNESILLAGNELPWFEPAPNLPPIERGKSDQKSLRILLSHSPDQIDWAMDHEIDLVLAGHTHGGQIRFPIVGPILAPSRFGVKYASGLFVCGDTVMHVSRGLSGLDPIRWNCPPELARLVLRAGCE